MRSILPFALVVATLFAGVPVSTSAQSSAGGLAGTVRDSSGAVLPGVTVEASSPALIEKARVAFTDTAGQYRIIELRPGTYALTFTLPGFSAVKREGIEITSGFTATVNAELQVGSVSETITVSGGSPVVDVQSTRTQVVLSRAAIDTVPTGKNFASMALLVPGVGTTGGVIQQDVGGASGKNGQTMFVHGGRDADMQTHIDGMSTQTAGGSRTAHALADGNFQELALETSGNSAEIESGGVRLNMIPREGGNLFRGNFNADVAAIGLQGDNLDDELRAAGVSSVNKSDKLWSINPAFGGPIVRDKLWFFVSYTQLRADVKIANSYVNSNPAAWDYVPDLSRQAVTEQYWRDAGLRLTWQASRRTKLALYANRNYVCNCHLLQTGPVRSEASINAILDNYMAQGTVVAPVTSRFLLEGGFSTGPSHQEYDPRPEVVAPRIVDNGLGVTYRGPAPYSVTDYGIQSMRGSASYVTGSHAAKIGMTAHLMTQTQRQRAFDDVIYTALNGTPTQVTYYGTPISIANRARPNLGIFAQDVWAVKRFTMNLGLRYDYLHSGFPDQRIEPTRYVPVVREFAGQDDVTSWHDLSPRLGLAWDVFGTGRTAVKVSANRYVLQQGLNIASQVNPIANNNSNPRAWTDTNGDRVVQGDPFNQAANGELGASNNPNFGKPVVSYTLDPDWAHGFGVRPANWEFSSGIQQQLTGGVAANFTVYRRIYTNFFVTDLPNVGPGDFSYYCVMAPRDARLPDGGGQSICGVPDLNPARLATAGTVVGTGADKYGKQQEHWTGFDATLTARLAGLQLQGGVSTGKTMLDNCAIVAQVPEAFFSVPALLSPIVPSSTLQVATSPVTGAIPTSYCHAETKMLTQVKLLGSYVLPWQVQVSATFQSVPGPQLTANATYTAAQVLPELGRAPVAGTAMVNLIEPGTAYGERMNQLDLRISKQVVAGRASVRGLVDFYNALNGNAVTVMSTTYGATTGAAIGRAWAPTQVLAARIIKFGVQVTF